MVWVKSENLICGCSRHCGLTDRSGATGMEYTLIGIGIGVAITAALFGIGDEMGY